MGGVWGRGDDRRAPRAGPPRLSLPPRSHWSRQGGEALQRAGRGRPGAGLKARETPPRSPPAATRSVQPRAGRAAGAAGAREGRPRATGVEVRAVPAGPLPRARSPLASPRAPPPPLATPTRGPRRAGRAGGRERGEGRRRDGIYPGRRRRRPPGPPSTSAAPPHPAHRRVGGPAAPAALARRRALTSSPRGPAPARVQTRRGRGRGLRALGGGAASTMTNES